MKSTRRPAKLPQPVRPDSAEREYFKFLHKYAKSYISLMRAALGGLLPYLRETASSEAPRADAGKITLWSGKRIPVLGGHIGPNIEEQIARMLGHVDNQMHRVWVEEMLRRHARQMIGGVNRLSKKNTAKTMKAAYRKADEVPDFEPLMHDRHLSPFFENIVDENVGLIRSLATGKQVEFKNQLVALLTADQNQATIRKAIDKYFSGIPGRAALIARDQVGKLNGKLNKYRQEQLGGTRYKWRSSADARERPDHRLLNNTTQLWSKPPIIDRTSGRRGHPGDDFQCRCWAEMVVEDILD